MIGIPCRNKAHFDAVKALIDKISPENYLLFKEARGCLGELACMDIVTPRDEIIRSRARNVIDKIDAAMLVSGGGEVEGDMLKDHVIWFDIKYSQEKRNET